MRYDRCRAFDLYVDGDTDGIWVAGNGSKIDDIGSCLEQVICLRHGSMLVQEASSWPVRRRDPTPRSQAESRRELVGHSRKQFVADSLLEGTRFELLVRERGEAGSLSCL